MFGVEVGLGANGASCRVRWLQVFSRVRARRAGQAAGRKGGTMGIRRLVLIVSGPLRWGRLGRSAGYGEAWAGSWRAPPDQFGAYFHVFSVVSCLIFRFTTYPWDFLFQSKREVPP